MSRPRLTMAVTQRRGPRGKRSAPRPPSMILRVVGPHNYRPTEKEKSTKRRLQRNDSDSDVDLDIFEKAKTAVEDDAKATAEARAAASAEAMGDD